MDPGYLPKFKSKGECLDISSKNLYDVSEFIKSNKNDNIIIGFEDSIHCYRRSKLFTKKSTVYDSGRTYTYVYPGGYICPTDLGSVQNTSYSIYYFEPLRVVGDKQIYNVKPYTLEQYENLDLLPEYCVNNKKPKSKYSKFASESDDESDTRSVISYIDTTWYPS